MRFDLLSVSFTASAFPLNTQSLSSSNCSSCANGFANASFALPAVQMHLSLSCICKWTECCRARNRGISSMDTTYWNTHWPWRPLHRPCTANTCSPCIDAPGAEILVYTWYKKSISCVYHLSNRAKHRTEPIGGIHYVFHACMKQSGAALDAPSIRLSDSRFFLQS